MPPAPGPAACKSHWREPGNGLAEKSEQTGTGREKGMPIISSHLDEGDEAEHDEQ